MTWKLEITFIETVKYSFLSILPFERENGKLRLSPSDARDLE